MAITFERNKPPMYEGCVLDLRERNGYSDSDWYAICWNDETNAVEEVCYASTRYGGNARAAVDASEEVIYKAYRFYRAAMTKRFDEYYNPDRAKHIDKGDVVRVVRGRKVPQGTVGTVFWLGALRNRYTYKLEDRVGIKLDDASKVFLPLEYVEKVGWQALLLHGKARKKAIRKLTIAAMPAHYRYLFVWQVLAPHRCAYCTTERAEN